MKKLLFAVAAVVAVSFASCDGNANTQATEELDSLECCDATEVEVVETEEVAEEEGDSTVEVEVVEAEEVAE